MQPKTALRKDRLQKLVLEITLEKDTFILQKFQVSTTIEYKSDELQVWIKRFS